MALVLSNRVQETATANTTVSFTLLGAVSGFQTFSVIGDTNTTYYSATDGDGNWEVGLGTYSTSGATLTRTTVYESSNSGSAVTFSGAVNVFVTYPSGRSVNLDATGNVSALGTVSSGAWQGSTVGVAYGGTGVTASSGANSVVLRDANQNVSVNSVTQSISIVTAAAGTTILTTASPHFQILVGTGVQTFALPDATSLPTGSSWIFDNDSTGDLTVTNNAGATLDVVAPGGYATVFLEANGTVGGTWGRFGMIPNEVNWGTNNLNLGGSTLVSGGSWQGSAVAPAYGGTGLTTFTGANKALYSTGACTLTAGTLPLAAGGTGQTTAQAAMDALAGATTSGSYLRGNGTNVTMSTIQAGDVPTLNQNTTGTAAGLSTTLAVASGGTGQTTRQAAMDALAGATTSGQYLRGNGTDVVMSAIQAADVPTLNQNTTGTAAGLSTTLGVASGGTGQTTYTNGQLLIGNTTGNTLSKATLTAGTGISITNGSGAITISASGGTVVCASPTTAGKVFGKTCFLSGRANLGYTAGAYCQGSSAVAVGYSAGKCFQSSNAVAIGYSAGKSFQGCYAIAIGRCASYCGQASYSISMGYNSRASGTCSIAIGTAAYTNYGVQKAIVIGTNAYATQSPNSNRAVVIGACSYATGYCYSGDTRPVVVGSNSSVYTGGVVIGGMSSTNDNYGITIGYFASNNQAYGVVIGFQATAQDCGAQRSNSVVIGKYAFSRKNCSVVIGANARAFSCKVTALGACAYGCIPNATYIKTLRNVSTCYYVRYNPSTGELTYA